MPEDKNLEGFLTVMRALEKKRNSRICCILHKNSHICRPTKWWLRMDRASVGRGDKLEILLYSPGGHPEIAYQAMKFFRGRFKTVNVIVPLGAKSAATLMCLGADTIYMGELAELGPIDIQIDDPVEQGGKSFSPLDEFKSMEHMRDLAVEWIDYYATVIHESYDISIHEGLMDAVPLVTSLMRPILEQIDPIEMGGYRRAIAISEEYARRMLAITGNPNQRAITRHMVWDYPAHDFCIDFDEATQIGLPVARLPLDEDFIICQALFTLDKDEYHGFVSPPPQPEHQPRKQEAKAPKAAAKPVRPKRIPPTQAQSIPVRRGSNGTGERSSAT